VLVLVQHQHEEQETIDPHPEWDCLSRQASDTVAQASVVVSQVEISYKLGSTKVKTRNRALQAQVVAD